MKNVLIVFLILLNLVTLVNWFKCGLDIAHGNDNLYRLKDDFSSLSKGLNFVKRDDLLTNLENNHVNFRSNFDDRRIEFDLLIIHFDENQMLVSLGYNKILNP